jgi:hypothetical protein
MTACSEFANPKNPSSERDSQKLVEIARQPTATA